MQLENIILNNTALDRHGWWKAIYNYDCKGKNAYIDDIFREVEASGSRYLKQLGSHLFYCLDIKKDGHCQATDTAEREGIYKESSCIDSIIIINSQGTITFSSHIINNISSNTFLKNTIKEELRIDFSCK